MHRFRTGGAVPCCCDPDGGFDASRDEAQTSYLLRARCAPLCARARARVPHVLRPAAAQPRASVCRAAPAPFPHHHRAHPTPPPISPISLIPAIPYASELISPNDFIAEAFANSPPYFMLRSGTTRGNTKPYRNNLARSQVGAGRRASGRVEPPARPFTHPPAHAPTHPTHHPAGQPSCSRSRRQARSPTRWCAPSRTSGQSTASRSAACHPSTSRARPPGYPASRRRRAATLICGA